MSNAVWPEDHTVMRSLIQSVALAVCLGDSLESLSVRLNNIPVALLEPLKERELSTFEYEEVSRRCKEEKKRRKLGGGL